MQLYLRSRLPELWLCSGAKRPRRSADLAFLRPVWLLEAAAIDPALAGRERRCRSDRYATREVYEPVERLFRLSRSIGSIGLGMTLAGPISSARNWGFIRCPDEVGAAELFHLSPEVFPNLRGRLK
jgi:hypothetical protein